MERFENLMLYGTTHLLYQPDENLVIVINNVPALICEQCGDDFVGIEIARKIESMVEKLESGGIKMGFVDYRKAA